MAKRQEEASIEIVPMKTETIRCCLLGTTPLIMHRFPRKAWQELLLPKGRKNKAERAETLKHDPLMEFRESIYLNREDMRGSVTAARGNKQPTLVHLPTGCFTKGMSNAALDVPGATKAEITRLVWCSTTQINMYGIPHMYMAMVRQSDIRHTPDVRTRAMFPEWACEIEITFISTLLKQNQIVSLLGTAGQIIGVCDWRQEKGGPHGKFAVVTEDDPDYRRIIRDQGREAQAAARWGGVWSDGARQA